MSCSPREINLGENGWGSAAEGGGLGHNREQDWAYLLQSTEQGDTPGIGATDQALGVLQAESHHGWVDHRGRNADGMAVSYTLQGSWSTYCPPAPNERELPSLAQTPPFPLDLPCIHASPSKSNLKFQVTFNTLTSKIPQT